MEDDSNYIVELAQGRMERGVLYEPRVYFDVFDVDGVNEVMCHAGTFRNGEKWPVKITHMTAAMQLLSTDPQVPDAPEELLQWVGLRMLWSGSFYMNQNYLPIPLWGTEITSTAEFIGRSTACWKPEPFMLARNDTLVVDVESMVAPAQDEALPVTVTVSGVGARSGQPYKFSGTRELLGVAPVRMNTEDFRNNSGEPVLITEIVANVSAETGEDDPQGEIRRLALNIHQVNSGTGVNQWFIGPGVPVPIANLPAALLGVTSGRAVVHKFPNSIIWEQGNGFDLFIRGLVALTDVRVAIALHGYIMVQ